MTMPAAPPPEWIVKAAGATSNWPLDDLHPDDREVAVDAAAGVLAAIWPDVLAAVAAHEQQLRQTIAAEIERECQRPALMTVRREALDDAYASAYRILRTFDATFGSPDRTGAP